MAITAEMKLYAIYVIATGEITLTVFTNLTETVEAKVEAGQAFIEAPEGTQVDALSWYVDISGSPVITLKPPMEDVVSWNKTIIETNLADLATLSGIPTGAEIVINESGNVEPVRTIEEPVDDGFVGITTDTVGLYDIIVSHPLYLDHIEIISAAEFGNSPLIGMVPFHLGITMYDVNVVASDEINVDLDTVSITMHDVDILDNGIGEQSIAADLEAVGITMLDVTIVNDTILPVTIEVDLMIVGPTMLSTVNLVLIDQVIDVTDTTFDVNIKANNDHNMTLMTTTSTMYDVTIIFT